MFDPPQLAAVATMGEPPMPTLPTAPPPKPYVVPYTSPAFDFASVRRRQRRVPLVRTVYSRTWRRAVLTAR